MANRYWVGGTNTWNSVVGTKWATTSGGAGGASVPTSSDDVFFDANSGAVTVTMGATQPCRNLDFSGFVGTITGTGNSISVFGNLVLASGMSSVFSAGSGLTMSATTTGKTITSNGHTWGGVIAFLGSGGGWTLQDDWQSSNASSLAFNHNRGTFDANGFDVTIDGGVMSQNFTRTLILGSGTWHVSGKWDMSLGTNLTLTSTGSTIRMEATTSSTFEWDGGEKTYNVVVFAPVSGAPVYEVSRSSTFDTLTFDTTNAPVTLTFLSNYTFTVTNFNAVGSLGKEITFNSDDLTNGIFSKSSGIVNCDYLILSENTATGGAIWNAGSHSINGGGNSGWIFAGSTGNFFGLM